MTAVRKPTPVRASWLAASLVFAPLAVLGEALLSKTHHRPLGAVTFASAAILLWLVAELVARRVLDVESCPGRAPWRKVLWVVCALVNVTVLVRAVL